MSQQFRIESEALRDKINSLLPSQARGGIGVDLSGSTTVIPIVDLTETAEGSSLRQDLQTSFSLTTSSAFDVANTTTTLVNTTGYYRIFGRSYGIIGTGANLFTKLTLTDGITSKIIYKFGKGNIATGGTVMDAFDINVFLEAGESITANTNSATLFISGATRQIATIAGELVNP